MANSLLNVYSPGSHRIRQLLLQIDPIVHQLIVSAKQVLEHLEHTELIRSFSMEEVPERYRDDVSAYFEQLSKFKSGQKPSKKP